MKELKCEIQSFYKSWLIELSARELVESAIYMETCQNKTKRVEHPSFASCAFWGGVLLSMRRGSKVVLVHALPLPLPLLLLLLLLLTSPLSHCMGNRHK